jgi:TonB family protein
MRFPTIFICAVLAITCTSGTLMPVRAAAAPGDDAKDLAELLARPMSPGSVALLVHHVAQQAAQVRLIEAIKHPDPAVRAVAARIAFVTVSKGLVPTLVSTVAKEENPHTAAEQIRALMGMLGAPGDSLVMRHVQRIGGPAATVMAESLARTRPADLVKHLPALFAATGEPETLGGPLAAALVQNPSFANEIVRAVLAANNEKLWVALLSSARTNTSGSIPSAVLLQALQSSEEYQRTAVVSHLFHIIIDGDSVPDDVVAAAAPKPIVASAASVGDLTWEDFSREMLARARGTPPTNADWARLIAFEKNNARVRSLSPGMIAYLTPDELKAVDAVRGFSQAEPPRRNARATPERKRPAANPLSRTHVMRTIPVFSKGLLADLLQVTGCKPPNESYLAVGDVTYRPEGGPQRISVVQASLSKPCEQFVYSMMKLTIALAERPITPESADRIVLLFNRQYLACADDPFPPVQPRARLDSTIVPPKRTRAAKIVYPQVAQRARIEGVVILGVMISHTGCVSSAETLRSLEPVLDLAAIQGVFTAAYTPTLLDGQPVPTIMTYTVNFDLR